MIENQKTFADKVNEFNAGLNFTGILPPGISIMNPFRENSCAKPASRAFYDRYYADQDKRGIILGINPGRFGAGITGVPFTDPVRLREKCGIEIAACPKAREPSSEFIYEVIMEYGGVEKFYRRWYINSVCPLGFIKNANGENAVNYNYYDSQALEKAAKPFILETLAEQISFGIHTKVCICLGTGKNAAFLKKINAEQKFFQHIAPIEHPRYVIQYKSKEKQEYIGKYIRLLREWEKNFQES